MVNFAANEVLQMTVAGSNFLLQGVMLLVAIASLVASITALKNVQAAHRQRPTTTVDNIGIPTPHPEPRQIPATPGLHADHPRH
jgi:hypothetical protein